MSHRGARATTYLVVALLLVFALRFTPELPQHRAADVLQQGAPIARSPVAATPAPVLAHLEQLERGETLIGLLKRAGISEDAAMEVVRAATASALNTRYLRPGMKVEVTSDSAGETPRQLVFHLGVDRLLRMQRSASGWSGTEERLPWSTDTVVVGGTIHANLYQAMDSSAASYFPGHSKDELAWALADIFEYKVDMSRDLQEGDRFRALVERQVAPNGATRLGKVLAASFSLSGSDVSAVRFDSKTSSASYYDENGKSLRAQFLRAPLEFRRISSTFGRRFHPILGQWKSHKGTDYAASPGTPVRAIGDAQVVRAGWGGGYGNVLELRHRNGYVTRYGHLRGFAKGVRPGARVEIGQTVAYVGTTGLSTGPHLHFEVLVDGVQRDSRAALRSTGGEPLSASERAAFEQLRGRLLASLDGTQGVVRLALR
ncbi:MAG TPA: M23 family metallopeptidase [Gemmatimonadaceae bacterium]|nr:M23 family metallopeptidase [Gemmatimonadaceae bacterium]